FEQCRELEAAGRVEAAHAFQFGDLAPPLLGGERGHPGELAQHNRGALLVQQGNRWILGRERAGSERQQQRGDNRQGFRHHCDRGQVKRIQVDQGGQSTTSTLPPAARSASRTMDSPRPLPLTVLAGWLAPWKKGSKTRLRSAAGMPLPWSQTESSTAFPAGALL